MFGYKLIIEQVWSNNILLPKASIIKERLEDEEDDYYPALRTNSFKNFTFRLRPRFVKKERIKGKQ